jgi:hypothetical protein
MIQSHIIKFIYKGSYANIIYFLSTQYKRVKPLAFSHIILE